MLKRNLEQREKLELIAIIQHMLRQEPDLQWLLMTPLPTTSSRKSSVDPEVYRQQVLAAMAAGENLHKHKRGEVERRLTAMKSIADEFAAQENYATAFTIYEVLERNDRLSRVGYRMPLSKKRPGAAANDLRFCWQL